MAKLPRIKQEIFGSEAGPQDIGVVGSLHEGNPTYALTTEQIQSLEAFKRGLRSVVIGENSPILEEDNGMYKLITQQLAYLLQRGIPEWNEDTIYYRGSWVTGPNSVLYFCTNDNTTTPPSDTVNWMEFNIDPDQWPINYVPSSKVSSKVIAKKTVKDIILSDIDPSVTSIPATEIKVENKNKKIILKVSPDSGDPLVTGGGSILFTKPAGITSETSFVMSIEKKVGSGVYEIFRTVSIALFRPRDSNLVSSERLFANLSFEVDDDNIHVGEEVFYRLAVGEGSFSGYTGKSFDGAGITFSAEYQ